MPQAGPLYVDYSSIDEKHQDSEMETVPYRQYDYTSESNILDGQQRYNRTIEEEQEQYIQEKQHKQRQRTSNEPQPQR